MKSSPQDSAGFASPLAVLSAIWPVGCVALLSWISILVCLDPGGNYPNLPEGPGLTIDELFNVEQGVYLVEHARRLGWLNLVPGTSEEVYQVQNGYNPDHPPLGRWWLGLHHHVVLWSCPPSDPELPFVTVCARTGSATAFALTLFMIGSLATFWSGRAAGLMTAISLLLMPRVYAHAHLASLETITNLTCTGSVLAIATFWNGRARPSTRIAICSGVLLALAFLTKIQAIFIPLPVICWAFWRWRTKAIVPLLVWGVSAGIVFMAGWPYLWSDTISHLGEYFGRTTNRATLQVWYFGQKYSDKAVPWHYPFVMFALTVPAALHFLGFVGLFSKQAHQSLGTNHSEDQSKTISNQSARDYLLLAALLLPLIVFAVPNVAVYDCERLFLTSFPLWAIFVGRGWIVLWQQLLRFTRSKQLSAILCALFLLFETIPLISMSPCQLTYYNSVFQLKPDLIDALGLEVDYWGVGITRGLLERTANSVPEGSIVAIVPTLHPFQADDFRRQSPILRKHQIKTVENRETRDGPTFALVYQRRADLPPDFERPGNVIEVTQRGGHWLAYLKRLKD